MDSQQEENINTMIVIGYLFVYDSEWQDVPYHLHKNLADMFVHTEDFPMKEIEPEKIKERWTDLKTKKSPIYEKWSKKSKKDQEVIDYCYFWGVWS